MGLERNPSTTKKAILLLQGAGRGAISEHGAQMAIELLESNGFQIWEVTPDKPEEPTPPPKPEPTYASKESISLHYQEVRRLQDTLDAKTRDMLKEFSEALWNMEPVLEAIRRAMAEKDNTSETVVFLEPED